MRALARGVMEAGAAGVMIAPPSHLRTDDAGRHLFPPGDQGRSATTSPWVLQDYPQLFQGAACRPP